MRMMREYSHSDLMRIFNMKRGELNNYVNCVLSGIKACGHGRHRVYTQVNLGEIIVGIALNRYLGISLIAVRDMIKGMRKKDLLEISKGRMGCVVINE